MIYKVANENLKIDPRIEKWCSHHHPFFFQGLNYNLFEIVALTTDIVSNKNLKINPGNEKW
jgi:hypothetical protein